MIRLLIADDHKVLLDGFKSIFNHIEDIEVVATANNGVEVLSQLEKSNDLDIVLLDINMPEMNGIETCKIVTKKYQNIKVIALSMHNKQSYINRMLKNGASGYILKNAGATELESGIRKVHAGEKYVSMEAMDTLLSGQQENVTEGEIPPLTKREKEVLELIASEYTTKEIAKKLFVSFETVQTHRKHLIQKFNAKNIVGVIKKATDNGLL